jgi:hypothetical protein
MIDKADIYGSFHLRPVCRGSSPERWIGKFTTKAKKEEKIGASYILCTPFSPLWLISPSLFVIAYIEMFSAIPY